MSTDTASQPADPSDPAVDLSARLADDLVTLDRELSEIDLLVTQARTEASRHEGRRTAAEEKLASLPEATEPKDRIDALTTIVTLTKRASLMEAQVDVLEGKRRALARYRDAVAAYLDAAEQRADTTAKAVDGDREPARMSGPDSRVVLAAQEDLRRDIARAMHDGPAQSLTNIVLQAEIVERLLERDPASAPGEVRLLIDMVQKTLDATKTFIFDVRPMVLDDLGLVPTLRRATRDRGRRAEIPVEFDSLGADRRLPADLESGLFRILDEALAAYVAAGPDTVALRLDWGEQLDARVVAVRAVEPIPVAAEAPGPVVPPKDLPPALAAMIEDRRADERDAVEAAIRDAIVVLPEGTWREIQDRATALGITVELLAGGGELHVVAILPAADEPGAPAEADGAASSGSDVTAATTVGPTTVPATATAETPSG